MKSTSSRLLFDGCVSLLAVQLLWACDGTKPQKANVEVVRPVRAIQILDAATFSGRGFTGIARAARRVDLSFEVSGRIVQRPIEIGDRVTTGQLLVALDPRDFENALRAAQAMEMEARAFRDRVTEAHKTGAVSDQRLTDAETQLQAARSTVAIRAKALEDATITAPYDGTISAIYADNFQVVTAGQVVARLINASRIEMVVDIPENAIGLVPYVKGIRVRFDAFPDHEIPAAIKEVGDEASATTRTYPVTLIMDQPQDFSVEAGMTGHATGHVDFSGGHTPPDTFVPASAVIANDADGASHVWVVDANAKTVAKRAVKVGAATPQGIPVEDGLHPGDWVVTAGANTLTQGQRVEILDVSRDEWRLPMPQTRSVAAGSVTLNAETH